MTSDTSLSTQLRRAIRAWERKAPVSGSHADLTVARRHLGGRKGYAVRLLAGREILTEWRRPTEAAAQDCYLSVMQALSKLSGFGGVTATSSDEETITGDMLKTRTGDRLEGAAT